MIDLAKLETFLASYKKDFITQHWGKGRYKWEAVQQFNENWDINAEDFGEMFTRATDKTANLLAYSRNFPRQRIQNFAVVDAEATRAMFINLFDESKDFVERVGKFQSDAEELRIKYDDGTWKYSYQHPNSISTYLWLRYPDTYYIYKYTECRAVARALENEFIPKKGVDIPNMVGVFKLYDEIREYLAKDKKLKQMLQSVLRNDCYPDKSLNTLTIDVCFYISRIYLKKPADNVVQWLPNDYSPNITTETWLSLLANETIFTRSRLEIMKRMMDYGGIATCKQLSAKYGETNNFYNAGSSSLAKRVAEATGCPVRTSDEGNTRWWPILYVGRNADRDTEGSYVWKLRDELREALEQFDLSNVNLYANETIEVTNEAYSKEDFLAKVYMTGERFDTLVSLLKNKQNLILQGAPGVGKTFAAKRLAYAMMEEKDDSRVEFIQFHQNYSYEDFVMGYKPSGEGFELQNGIFYRFCQKAANMPDKPFFFIIDEINRGNLSKIFGELLMLIEKDYRGTKATLAYQGMLFAVPKNLYIIGMMNNADRSLAMMDYALRRRFSFFEMEPGFDSDGFKAYQAGFSHGIFNILVERVKELNQEITEDSSLGKGFCIGHSYFCGRQECTDTWLAEIVKYDILPMLGEYWFDDPAKLNRWDGILRGIFHDEQ